MADNETSLLFKFDKREAVEAFDLSNLVFDINRIYASAVWTFLDQGWRQTAQARSPFSFNRFAFRLPERHPLRVVRIRFESPGLLEIATVTSLGIGALWVLLQCVEKIENWRLNREKLKLEIEKLRRELRPEITPRRIEPYLKIPPVRGAIMRLDQNPLKPNDISSGDPG